MASFLFSARDAETESGTSYNLVTAFQGELYREPIIGWQIATGLGTDDNRYARHSYTMPITIYESVNSDERIFPPWAIEWPDGRCVILGHDKFKDAKDLLRHWRAKAAEEDAKDL